MIRHAIAAVGLCALMIAPGVASDFSKLSEPQFARMLLLDPFRAREAQCATVALANARLGRGAVKESDALAMAQVVKQRVAAEVGAEDEAQSLVVTRAEQWSPDEWNSAEEKKQKLDMLDLMGGQCESYYAAYAQGGLVAYSAKLKPQGPLIPLLPVADCVAIADASRAIEYAPFQKREIAEIESALAATMSPPQRVEHAKAVAQARNRLKAQPPSEDVLGRQAIACMASFRQHLAPVAAER